MVKRHNAEALMKKRVSRLNRRLAGALVEAVDILIAFKALWK